MNKKSCEKIIEKALVEWKKLYPYTTDKIEFYAPNLRKLCEITIEVYEQTTRESQGKEKQCGTITPEDTADVNVPDTPPGSR